MFAVSSWLVIATGFIDAAIVLIDRRSDDSRLFRIVNFEDETRAIALLFTYPNRSLGAQIYLKVITGSSIGRARKIL